jgi:hypothetical protein
MPWKYFDSDTWTGAIAGVVGGGLKFFLLGIHFSDGFLVKVIEGCMTAFIFGAVGVLGKKCIEFIANKVKSKPKKDKDKTS